MVQLVSSQMAANVIEATTLETVIFVVDDGRRMVASTETTSEIENHQRNLYNTIRKPSGKIFQCCPRLVSGDFV